MAESEGFEPPDRANGQWFSKPPHSTALPTLHCLEFFKRVNYTEFVKNSQLKIILPLTEKRSFCIICTEF